MELEAYRDKYAAVRAKGADVVAISLDDVATLKRFRESLGAPFPFLSDPGGRVSRLYAGVSLHTANRVTVDIDSDGTIAHVREGLGALFPDQRRHHLSDGAPVRPDTNICVVGRRPIL